MCGVSLLMAVFLFGRLQRSTDSLIHLLTDIRSNAPLTYAVEVKPWLVLR